jgi:hypothetical protein
MSPTKTKTAAAPQHNANRQNLYLEKARNAVQAFRAFSSLFIPSDRKLILRQINQLLLNSHKNRLFSTKSALWGLTHCTFHIILCTIHDTVIADIRLHVAILMVQVSQAEGEPAPAMV